MVLILKLPANVSALVDDIGYYDIVLMFENDIMSSAGWVG
jgi:hypothetical protein